MKTQMKLQKIASYLFLASAVLVFVYALSFMTGIYDSLYDLTGFDKSTQAYKYGQLYYQYQPFNDTLTIVGIGLIFVAVIVFIVHTHSRRKYYIGNYISTGLCLASGIAAPIWAWINISSIRVKYVEAYTWLDQRFAEMGRLLDEGTAPNRLPMELRSLYMWDITYNTSTFWLDVSYFVFGLLILSALSLVAVTIWKVILMKEEDSLLATTKLEEVTE